MKKTLCILLAALLSATAFVSCNDDTTNKNYENTVSEEHKEAQSDTDNKKPEDKKEATKEHKTAEEKDLSIDEIVENTVEVLNSIKSFRQSTETRQEINIMGQCSELEIFIDSETDIENGISKNHSDINGSETKYYILQSDDGLNLYYDFSGIWSKQEGIDTKVAAKNGLTLGTASSELLLKRLAESGTLTKASGKYILRGEVEADDEFMEAIGFKNSLANILFDYGIGESEEVTERITNAISSFGLSIEIDQDTFYITKTSVNMADAYYILFSVIFEIVFGESAAPDELNLAVGNCYTETVYSDHNEIGKITIPKEAFDSMDYTFFS